MNTNSLEDLKALAFPVKIDYDDEDALYVAEFPDLPGCSATGSTVTEAYDNAQLAKAAWLQVTLQQGLPIPKPSRTRDFSGRVLVRLPVSLHATLSDRARINGASLNQYIVHLLSAGAAGDQVTSRLEAVTTQLQEIGSRMAVRSVIPVTGIRLGGIEQSEMLGWQTSSHQGITPWWPNGASAFESARTP
jgi:antitoxin HicB